VINGEGEGLGFVLAAAGYDVWLGNSRGNTYGREHEYLNPDDPAFWAFSWDQFQMFDLPAKISYILSTTGMPSLSYIGHSEVIFFLLLLFFQFSVFFICREDALELPSFPILLQPLHTTLTSTLVWLRPLISVRI
jgi:hypothetical protein